MFLELRCIIYRCGVIVMKKEAEQVKELAKEQQEKLLLDAITKVQENLSLAESIKQQEDSLLAELSRKPKVKRLKKSRSFFEKHRAKEVFSKAKEALNSEQNSEYLHSYWSINYELETLQAHVEIMESDSPDKVILPAYIKNIFCCSDREDLEEHLNKALDSKRYNREYYRFRGNYYRTIYTISLTISDPYLIKYIAEDSDLFWAHKKGVSRQETVNKHANKFIKLAQTKGNTHQRYLLELIYGIQPSHDAQGYKITYRDKFQCRVDQHARFSALLDPENAPYIRNDLRNYGYDDVTARKIYDELITDFLKDINQTLSDPPYNCVHLAAALEEVKKARPNNYKLLCKISKYCKEFFELLEADLEFFAWEYKEFEQGVRAMRQAMALPVLQKDLTDRSNLNDSTKSYNDLTLEITKTNFSFNSSIALTRCPSLMWLASKKDENMIVKPQEEILAAPAVQDKKDDKKNKSDVPTVQNEDKNTGCIIS